MRGIVLSLGAFTASLLLAGFPHIENLHGSPGSSHRCWSLPGAWRKPAAACVGKWSLYHAGVLFLLYSDLMILTLIVFLVAYPL